MKLTPAEIDSGDIQITFRKYNPADPKSWPKDETNVVCIVHHTFYHHYTLEIGRAERTWVILDETGRPTGSSICYSETAEQPKNTKVVITANGYTFGDDILFWHPANELSSLLEPHNEKNHD